MAAISSTSARRRQDARPASLVLSDALVSLATGVAILGVALLPLLTPLVIHPLLDLGQANLWLQAVDGDHAPAVGPDGGRAGLWAGYVLIRGPERRRLLCGGRSVASARRPHAAVPLRERSRSRHSRLVVWSLRSRGAWRAVSRGAIALIVAVIVIGVIGFFAFEPAFELFHEIFFPGGNWAFDPYTSHLVQLYPYVFWEAVSASLGGIAIGISLIVWWVARRQSRSKDQVSMNQQSADMRS